MSSPRDHLHDMRWRAANGRVHVQNAWYRAVGKHVQGARIQLSNWRNGRAISRGKRDLPAKAADQVRSRTPVLRNRTDPSTGRPNRDARDMGRLSDQSLARTQGRQVPSRQGRSR